MVPLSTILSRTRTRYESAVGGSSTRWSDSRLTDFVNEGLENIAEATLFYERYTTVPFQAYRTYYDLRGFTPETVVRIKSIYNTEGNIWLEPVNPDKLDDRWRQSTGDPRCFFTRGIYWFGIYPASASDSSANADDASYLRVYFAGLPNRFSNTQEVLRDLPDSMLPALEDYVLYEMAAIDKKKDMALHYWKSYQEREDRFKGFVNQRVGNGNLG
jgi:hypothetical protein